MTKVFRFLRSLFARRLPIADLIVRRLEDGCLVVFELRLRHKTKLRVTYEGEKRKVFNDWTMLPGDLFEFTLGTNADYPIYDKLHARESILKYRLHGVSLPDVEARLKVAAEKFGIKWE